MESFRGGVSQVSGIKPTFGSSEGENVEVEDPCALWIGNITSDVYEYDLMKAAQKFGKLAKFDFPLHQGGPEFGKPRGFCFISYSSPQQAKAAMAGLKKTAIGSKSGQKDELVVDFARGRYTDLSYSTFATKEELESSDNLQHITRSKSIKKSAGKFAAKKLRSVMRPTSCSDRSLLDKMALIEAKLNEMDQQPTKPSSRTTKRHWKSENHADNYQT